MGEMVTMKEVAGEMEVMEEMMTTVETTVVKKIDGSENSGYDMFAEPTKLYPTVYTGECSTGSKPHEGEYIQIQDPPLLTS
jgi:hypothetical protein